MMRILVFQHAPVEHPGIFREFWIERNLRWDAVELDFGEPIPDLNGYELLVVMGGPMDVWQENKHPWLVGEKAAIRRWVEQLKRPYLGICLGHQLLAEACGGKVTPMIRPEVGLAHVDLTPAGQMDRLLDGFGPRLEVFQWHGAEVSKTPPGAVILAASDACPVQAIRYGELAYGFQYHVEITRSTVMDWKMIPEYQTSLEQALGIEHASRLSDAVSTKLSNFRAAARKLNDNLMALVDKASSL
jgi:GMP synthase-like glutamine amidotransferase